MFSKHEISDCLGRAVVGLAAVESVTADADEAGAFQSPPLPPLIVSPAQPRGGDASPRVAGRPG
jgi:hypothetical protein